MLIIDLSQNFVHVMAAQLFMAEMVYYSLSEIKMSFIKFLLQVDAPSVQ